MANEEHLAILKKGVAVWNEWRKRNLSVRPDLAEAVLKGIDLSGAILYGADMRGADLAGADLLGADLREANLCGAGLSGGDFLGADLRGAQLSEADLGRADLSETSLAGANLRGANLENSTMGFASVGDVDLSAVKGLETVKHHAPSTIGIDTIYRSRGKIPKVFLRGAGVPETFITYMKSLVVEPIEYYSCFISYSSKDQELAERLHADLQSKNVRCWFAPKDLKIGDETRPRIDEAIRIHDKLLILLSKNSVRNPWVKKEVETALERERKQKRTVLFPIRLDIAVMKTKETWAADIRRMRNIGDFCAWKKHDKYKKAFERLMRDLKA